MKPLEKLPIPLLTWFAQNQRTMPWRSDPTPYHVWVSEIMLQQTRVAAVLDYYRRFMEAAPTVADLDGLSEEALMKLWQGLGYYNRARNLQKAAHQIMTDFGGVFPQSYEEIRTLSGVGDYTAGAISSIAFGLPTPAVDGNVLRVVARITGD
ncbi:MAG: A/G-specific adenine glycosylase, partial [Oscillospiraceae bacterium]